MKKILFIVILILLALVIAWYFYMKSDDTPGAYIDYYVDNSMDYYDILDRDCLDKEDQDCCRQAVGIMRKGGHKLADNGACFGSDMANALFCSSTYTWCEPKGQE